ncbi:MAG: hypothetical protein NVS4B12_21750 [Ktedonobacteraceae bacterium]
MKRALTLLLIFVVIVLSIFFTHNIIRQIPTTAQKEFNKIHTLGGFSIDTLTRAKNAASDGIQVVFTYNNPPSEGDDLGREMQTLHMKVVDAYISDYLYYYECHRIKTIKPPPSGQKQYCPKGDYPYVADEDALLASIASHLKQVKDNQLIVGYWVLDDWVSWDAGSVRQILIKIHRLIQQYTPDRPAICGFSGAIQMQTDHTTAWSDWIADNFSPQACDQVAFYIYAPSIPTSIKVSPDAYDWSMAQVLPAMFASLQRRGWNITKEPLIGIVQAFGGPRADIDDHWVTPSATDIETQSRSFCKHGATGLTFYAWDGGSEFGPTTQTPMNNTEIETGIRNGIAICRQYWANYP